MKQRMTYVKAKNKGFFIKILKKNIMKIRVIGHYIPYYFYFYGIFKRIDAEKFSFLF